MPTEILRQLVIDSAEADAYENGFSYANNPIGWLALFSEEQLLKQAVDEGVEVGPLDQQGVRERYEQVEERVEALLAGSKK